MLSLIYSALVLAILVYFLLLPARMSTKPPTSDNSDDGGEPLGDDLPDLDLPPGITLPINDFEPDYRQSRQPTKPMRIR